MPEPKQGESKEKYIARCMRYPDMLKYNQAQRFAICNDMYKSKSKK